MALELELVLTDIASVEQRITRQRRAAKSGDKEILAEVAALEKANVVLPRARRSGGGRSPRTSSRASRPVFLLTTKPLLIVANTGEELTTVDVARR